ncbi:hypothetical protein BGZ59_003025, partial [Podila verticillata]
SSAVRFLLLRPKLASGTVSTRTPTTLTATTTAVTPARASLPPALPRVSWARFSRRDTSATTTESRVSNATRAATLVPAVATTGCAAGTA